MSTDMKLHRMQVELPGGRVLHVALIYEDDVPVDLLIAAGFKSAGLRELLSDGVSMPASALPALRDALANLPAGASIGQI